MPLASAQARALRSGVHARRNLGSGSRSARCAAEDSKDGRRRSSSGASSGKAPYPTKDKPEGRSGGSSSSSSASSASSAPKPTPASPAPASSSSSNGASSGGSKQPAKDPKVQEVKPAPKQSEARAKATAVPPSPKSGGNVERMSIVNGYFRDDRWVNGTWDFKQFAKADGTTDWDKVIDAEMERRKLLEDTPIPSRNDDPVNFDTNMVPWWAWVKRFHLPEAEKLNGRAAMMGYLLAGLVDLSSGAGLIEQQESFFGKLLLHLVVFAILLIRNTDDVAKYKNLFDEATFYDKQWNATWEGQVRPSEQEKSQ